MPALIQGDSNFQQVKLENEKDIFNPDYKLPGSPDDLPYRKIWDVSFYNNKAELVSLNEIVKFGPFVGVASAEKSEGVKEEFKSKDFKISLHPVMEYSLELPYGRQARIWVTTETACYRIMSVSANYISYWIPFYDMVCFSGHVVNVLLNYTGPVMIVKLISKISKLSGKSLEETFSLLKEHRRFIQDLLKDQNLSAKVRKEYNALQSNSNVWDMTWDEHVKAAESKTVKKSKVTILSFFKSTTNAENNGNTQVSKPTLLNDDASSILSVSEDESATYIESPNEVSDALADGGLVSLKRHLSMSFSSTKFLEWSLDESSTLEGSLYKCPICKLAFSSMNRDCFSAFTVHLQGHKRELREAPELSRFDDFEERFSKFKNDLQSLISGKIVYSPIHLNFDKIIQSHSGGEVGEFKKYPIIDAEHSNGQVFFNPIKLIHSTDTNTNHEIKINPTAPAAKKSRPVQNASPKPVATPTGAHLSALKPSSSSAVLNNTSPDDSPKGPSINLVLTPNKALKVKSVPKIKNQSTNTLPVASSSSHSTAKASLLELHPNASYSTDTSLNHSETSSQPKTIVPALPSMSTVSSKSKLVNESSSVPVAPPILGPIAVPVPSLTDMVKTYNVNKKYLGCSHYKVNCKFYAECCGKWFSCRFCHDSTSDHKVFRTQTRFCLCMFCGTSQKANQRCTNLKCKALLARYYCDNCKFWDNDPDKLIYHCDKCKICRTGLKSNYTHCDECGKCILTHVFSDHNCVPSTPTSADSSPKTQTSDSFMPIPAPVPTLVYQTIGKRAKIDYLLIENSAQNPILIDSSGNNADAIKIDPKVTSLGQENYLNHLKNTLNLWIDKNPISAVSQSNNLPSATRSCWNCLNSLPLKGENSSKYCHHCSAIIE